MWGIEVYVHRSGLLGRTPGINGSPPSLPIGSLAFKGSVNKTPKALKEPMRIKRVP